MYESREGTSDFRLQTSDFRLQISDFRFQASDFRLQISDFSFVFSRFVHTILDRGKRLKNDKGLHFSGLAARLGSAPGTTLYGHSLVYCLRLKSYISPKFFACHFFKSCSHFLAVLTPYFNAFNLYRLV